MRCVPLCVFPVQGFRVPFLGPFFGGPFWVPVRKFWNPALLGPLIRAAFIGAHFWVPKMDPFWGRAGPISRPQKRPRFEPHNGCHKCMFFGIVAGKSVSATAFSCPQASGMMRLPVRRVLLCCAALARVHWKLSPRT